LTTVTRRRLQQKRRAERAQARTLPPLLSQLAGTQRGQQLGLDPKMSAAAFRQNVPLSTHQSLAPWMEQVKTGSANLLWPGTCDCFAATAGTTTGQPRLVPVTREMQASYSKAAQAAVLHATARAGGVHALLGRVLLVAGSVPTNQLAADAPVAIADLGTLAAVQHPEWIAHYYFEPSSRIALKTDWDDYIERILKRLRNRKVSMIAGSPQWLLAFEQHVTRKLAKGKLRFTSLRAVWPQLRCVAVTGDFLAPIQRLLKTAAGHGVALHEVFAMAEGVIAAQGPGAMPGLRLLAESGIYFEFLPLEDYDPLQLSELGFKAVPLDRVTPGRDYLLVMTTPAGLVRHLPGDIVRFTTVRPPRLLPMGQVDLRLNTFGENVLPREALTILGELCRSRGWTLSFFHVAPLVKRTELGISHGSHEWWIELQAGTIDTPTGPAIAQELDRRLREALPGYRTRRENGNLRAPLVRLVMPGAFEHWLRHTGRWGGPHKLPPTRDDRTIADSLSRMARFSKD
jgi:hypothetical protein